MRLIADDRNSKIASRLQDDCRSLIIKKKRKNSSQKCLLFSRLHLIKRAILPKALV